MVVCWACITRPNNNSFHVHRSGILFGKHNAKHLLFNGRLMAEARGWTTRSITAQRLIKWRRALPVTLPCQRFELWQLGLITVAQLDKGSVQFRVAFVWYRSHLDFIFWKKKRQTEKNTLITYVPWEFGAVGSDQFLALCDKKKGQGEPVTNDYVVSTQSRCNNLWVATVRDLHFTFVDLEARI